jgi:formylglycine-generating enzyme required for sulfatase activity
MLKINLNKTLEMKNFIRLFFLVLIFSPLITLYAQTAPETVKVEGGTFQMGNPYAEATKKGDADEKPVHSVTLSSYYIGKYEVTVKEYKEFISDKTFTEFSSLRSHKLPSKPDSAWLAEHPDTKNYWALQSTTWWGWVDQYPMQHITWYDAIAYCNWLSEKLGLEKCYYVNDDFGVSCDFTKNGYRLPTEAEWEFAARGGTKSKGYRYSGSDNSADVAWYDDTSFLRGPQKIGTKSANELGIYDMSGNVWEWCYDYFGYYTSAAQTNPKYETSTGYRILRGGSWHYAGNYTTVTTRDGPEPGFTNFMYGFRIAKNAN